MSEQTAESLSEAHDAAGTHQQPHAELGLQCADALGDGRRREVQPLRGLCQRVPLGNDNEGFEKTCVHR